MMERKSVLYNMLGTFLDKGLPMLISLLLTKFMTSVDYGRWSLLYSFMIISFAFGAAPVLTFFSRHFYNYELDKRKMYLYYYKWVALAQILAVVIFYICFVDFSKVAVIEIPTILCINIYSYIALFYRFSGDDKLYFKESLYRFILFSICLLVFIIINKNISYEVLVLIYICSHLPSIFKSLKLISFKYSDEEGGLKEFFFLSFYGLVSSLVTSLDRLIIVGLGLGFSFLGYYSFIYTVANIPAVVVEAFKKSVNPIMYKDLVDSGKLSSSSKKKIFYVLSLLFVLQLFVPSAVYYFLNYFNIINPDFVDGNSYSLIYILCVGLFFVAIYQLISPYYFFFKKTNQLLLVLTICLVFYVVIIWFIFMFGNMDVKSFSLTKAGLLCAITLLTFMVRVK